MAPTHARAHPHTAEMVDIPFSTCMTGGQFAPPKHQRERERRERGAAAILKVTPLIQAATVQLSGTMTEDDGFCCRGGIRQTERREKGLSTFGFKRARLLHGYSCLCVFKVFPLLTWFLLQWKHRWLVLRKPSPVAGTIPPTLSELLKYDVN